MQDYRTDSATKEEWAERAMNAERKLAIAINALQLIVEHGRYAHMRPHPKSGVARWRATNEPLLDKIAEIVAMHMQTRQNAQKK